MIKHTRKIIREDSDTYCYDEEGRCISQKEVKAGMVHYERKNTYDADGRLTEYWDSTLDWQNGHGSGFPNAYRNRIEYDPEGHKSIIRSYTEKGEIEKTIKFGPGESCT